MRWGFIQSLTPAEFAGAAALGGAGRQAVKDRRFRPAPTRLLPLKPERA